MAEGCSGEEQHGNDRDAYHEHGAEMRLEHEEPSEDARHKQDRAHRDLRVLDRPPWSAQQIGSEEHDRELEQLRRLHGELPHTKPTGRTVGREADPRNEDDDEQLTIEEFLKQANSYKSLVFGSAAVKTAASAWTKPTGLVKGLDESIDEIIRSASRWAIAALLSV